jgi:hypothetical protein
MLLDCDGANNRNFVPAGSRMKYKSLKVRQRFTFLLNFINKMMYQLRQPTLRIS